jgi:hypothetical protein
MTLGQRALEHASRLARTHRGSATQGEAQAARYVQAELTRLGITDVQTQPFSGLRSLWLFLTLAFGLALVGHAAFWILRQPLGNWPALGISAAAFGLSGALLWRKFTFRNYPLRQTLPHGPSQNVIAVIPPGQQATRRVVLVSHLDSHRAVFWFASDFLVRLFALSEPVAVYGVFAAPLLYALAALTGWEVFSWIALYLALNHFLGWFSGVTADLGPYSPGANDNAASVGLLLALAERLKQEPLAHTEVWLAFTGCEETGCDGLLKLLEQHGEQLKNAIFIDFELPGIGDQPVYLQTEGVLHKRRIPAAVEELARLAGQDFDLKPMRAARVGAFTEGGALWEHGYQAVTLLTLRKGSALLPEWHRLTDIPGHLQVTALEKMGELGWKILQQADNSGVG